MSAYDLNVYMYIKFSHIAAALILMYMYMLMEKDLLWLAMSIQNVVFEREKNEGKMAI